MLIVGMLPRPLFRHLVCAVVIGFCSTAAFATTYSFAPNDGQGDTDDMFDLDHYKYYTWGFKNFQIPEGECITSAKLTISNINNWTADENGYWKYVNGQWVLKPENWLNIWLLDGVSSYNSSTSGLLKVYNDTDGGPDYFSTWSSSDKAKIATYTDWSGGSNGDVVTLTYDFATIGVLDELEAFISNGNNFALGFDPDCHYWNTGVNLVIVTAPCSVPEAGNTVGLAGLGFGLIALLRRRLKS
jgi:hypothetical protein